MVSQVETKLYRSGEAARLIGIDHRTLQKYLQEGRIKPSGRMLGQKRGHYIWTLKRINEIRAMMDLPPLEKETT